MMGVNLAFSLEESNYDFFFELCNSFDVQRFWKEIILSSKKIA